MRRSFLPKTLDFLRQRKQAYKMTFVPGSAAQIAFADLAKFCRAFSGDIAPNDHDQTLVMSGRRDAFWRIWQHLNLEPDELAALYRAVEIKEGE